MNLKYLALTLLLLPLHAQEPFNPFKKVPDLPQDPNDLPVTVANHIEHFLVAKEFLHQWQANHPAEKITRDLVSNWSGQGQATAANSFFFSTRLDQSLSLHTGQSLTYPVEYTPSNFPGEWNIPSAFDEKWLGSYVDATFTHGDHESLQARFITGGVKFLGSDSHSTFIEETQDLDDLFMPLFKTYRQSGKMTYIQGAHHLVGILDSLEDETKALLIFSNAESIALDSIPKDKRPRDTSKPITVVSCELIELPAESWLDYCREKTPDQLRVNTGTWIAALLQEQKATRLKALSKEVSRGEKHDLNPKAKQSSYTTSYKPTDPSKRLSPSNPLVPAETLEGLKDSVLNITPEVTPSGHILLTYLWQTHTLRKNYVIHRVSDGEQWIPDAWAPCKSFLNLDGALFLNPGQNTLVGALPVKDDETNSTPAKMRLLFLKAK